MKRFWVVLLILFPLTHLIYCFSAVPSVYSNYDEIYSVGLKSLNHLASTQTVSGAFIPSDINMSASNTYAFVHSYILDTLMDARAGSFPISQEVILNAQQYLLQIRWEDCWNFSKDIPTDTDDSAIATIALHRSGIPKELLNSTLIKLNSTITPAGYSKFWISENDTVYIYFVANNSYTSYFGNVYDSFYLTAGTIYSLFLFNYDLYQVIVDKSVDVIESEQDSSGAWLCKYWYPGEYYGTFLCTRLVASVKPDSPTLSTAYDFLVNAQQVNGGWGRNAPSNPLDTALALISLYYLGKAGFHVENITLKGIEYLCAEQFDNGTYPMIPLWTSYPDTYYQGKSLTTIFVLKAIALYLSTKQATDPNRLGELIIIIGLLVVCSLGLYWYFVKNRNNKGI